jgi:hypothetical protein
VSTSNSVALAATPASTRVAACRCLAAFAWPYAPFAIFLRCSARSPGATRRAKAIERVLHSALAERAIGSASL